ncbi:TatD family hydrolase [Candidatus Uhrbacteria bacterium]|nr:TatD family hydrolase [Candidatus Uhrbacteria bacterium]
MLIDTHTHIQFGHYQEDREKLIKQCVSEHVGMILVGCEYESSLQAVDLARAYHAYPVWAAIGQHPTDTAVPFHPEEFKALAKQSERVVAIGECGLDYFHLAHDATDDAQKVRQKALFEAHLNLSSELSLPLIIHCRDAHDDMLQMLIAYFTRGGILPLEQRREQGVMHCFTGTVEQARSYLDLGFLISFTGIITFARHYDDVVMATPLEKILIETDSPFLSPVPFRGKRNSPLYVKYVAERIACLKGMTVEHVAKQTTLNAQRLFGLELRSGVS